MPFTAEPLITYDTVRADAVAVARLMVKEVVATGLPFSVVGSTPTVELAAIEKGGYDHFMLKEIFEQPQTIYDCLRGRLDAVGVDLEDR